MRIDKENFKIKHKTYLTVTKVAVIFIFYIKNLSKFIESCIMKICLIINTFGIW